MPKPKFSVSIEILEILCQYAIGEISQDDMDEKIDQVASYRNDVLSSVDAYYRGLETEES